MQFIWTGTYNGLILSERAFKNASAISEDTSEHACL